MTKSLLPPIEPLPSVTPPPASRAPESRVVTTSELPPRSTLPPLPAIETLVEDARAARSVRDWDAALEACKKALFVVGATDSGSAASLYADVAEIKLAQGKIREAETNFEKALSSNPKHVRSLDGLIGIASSEKDWSRVVSHRRKRADALDDVDERVAELCRLAEVHEIQLADPPRAAAVLEEALVARAGDVGILLKLRQVYEGVRAWPRVVEVLEELHRGANRPRERGAYRFGQADVVLGRLRDEPRGIAYLEMTLVDDPQHDRAFTALTALRTRREEWAELAAFYERLVDRLAGLSDRARAWEVCKRLGPLRRDRLHDGPGAIDAFRGAVELAPDDVESRAALAELRAAKGDRARAVEELERVAVHAPTRAHTFRRLFDLHTRANRPDRTWLVATCLEELAAAEMAHDLVIDQYRPDGPIRPTAGMDEGWWDTWLRAPGADPIVVRLLRIVSSAAMAARLAEPSRRRALASLEQAQKQDRNSTVSAVRTFAWAARALGLPLPDLYVLEGALDLAAVPSPTPATVLGARVLSGRTVQELAFLAGRHLTYYRPEHHVLVFYPTLSELSGLVLSAMRVVLPELAAPEGDARLTEELGRRLSADERRQLTTLVGELDARGGTLDLLAWIRHVELTAARAGLLLAGDLRTAMRIVKEEARDVAELTREARRGDLLAFTASDGYGQIRERMGVSILPAPPSSRSLV